MEQEKYLFLDSKHREKFNKCIKNLPVIHDCALTNMAQYIVLFDKTSGQPERFAISKYLKSSVHQRNSNKKKHGRVICEML